ncbi:putative mediator of RNA polymerase II transcription subunit 26c [Apostasia shenzhenica]|uniref:Putative mediator of RNA polymerase II transcription subunit 26c n=1 Tax=Apostasia shenzhenica TaxID=1088818 RepID=A0A2I0A7G1_9ASPA|nr:putative mediator of RNA polymerase II transcription subunit 26c [Apostasia shenzhenica]
MHGREGEERKRRWHMWPAAVAAEKPPVILPAAAFAADSVQTSVDSFLKQDGRKIRVGDCALFQAGNAPPFIGLIRWFSTTKEGCLTLCVNWLYRPADIKLAKSILLEAAPNEVFYSFHRDIISAASLLHPCKVAFLHKGVDLPSGTSSFVCRRVYDIANKCLWWLTDQDYINEHQEEVDLLLDKTRLEMHAAVQSGGRSPKRLNGPTSMQQLKSGSENGVTAHSSQIKGKKRDRGDQNTEPIKRECITKPDDGDSVICKFDNNMIKLEISKITEKGALVSTDGVEKLVQLMQVDNSKKIDLTGRVLLADVIAATDKIDCLNKFVQIRGVPVLDEWLQEAHKGKTGDVNSPKESEKAVEELLLALLRALDKLPVNLNALQTSHIGKSVNHLRGHKNLEIQKKARSLVDRWKKRVDAEMKTNDSRSVGSSQAVTWPVKPGFSEVSHTGNRRTGSGDLSMKSSVTQQSSYRGLTGRSIHADATVKSTNLTVGSGKLQSPAAVAISSKEFLTKVAGNIVELPLVVAKEEKSSSSSHSQNNSQSCSSDHGKNVGSSVKEDAKSSTAGSVNTSRPSSGSSRHRRSNNGIVAGNPNKSGSQIRNPTGEKVSQAGMSCERTVDLPTSDYVSSHRLIVRLPNPGRSPARSTSGGSLEDPSPGSRASSPCVQDKSDHVDKKMIGRTDSTPIHITSDVNAESWQSNDVKDGLVISDEGDRSTIIPDEECRASEEAGRTADISRTACSSSGNEKIEAKIRNSFSSMNALIESCAKYSEATTPVSGGDDIGMKLLASVAAGEMSKSDMVSPASSPEGSLATEDPFNCNKEPKSVTSNADNGYPNLGTSIENADFDLRKQEKDNKHIFAQDGIHALGANVSDNDKTATPLQGDKLQQNGLISDMKEDSNKEDARQNKDNERIGDGLTNSKFEVRSPGDQIDTNISVRYKIAGGKTSTSDVRPKSSSDGVDCELSAAGPNTEKVVVESSSSDHPLNKEIQCADSTKERPSYAENEKETAERKFDDARDSPVADMIPCPETVDKFRGEKSDELKNNCQEQIERNESTVISQNIKGNTGTAKPVGLASGGESVEINASLEKRVEGSLDFGKRPSFTKEADASARMHVANGESREEIASSTEQDAGAKLDFDLNEGITGDDANQSEPIATSLPVFSSAIRMSTSSNFASLSISNGSPATITVAAPAKGAFVPPENLLKSKGEPGWKGSAATSAFRPAEPRKVLDMPINSTDMQLCETAMSKQGRPTLEFDLNVADERAIEDLASQSSAQTTGSESGVLGNQDATYRAAGGLDLDLNRVDESVDNCQFVSTSRKLEVPLLSARSASGGFSHGDSSMLRDFDLNNGPSIDDVGAEPLSRSQSTKNSCNIPYVPPIAGFRVNSAELGSGWFPQGNSYPAVAIPSFLSDRGDQSYPIVAAAGAQRMLGSVTSSGTFGSDIYRSHVLSSSPAMAFSPAATSFSYASFPFGSSFPLTSTSFSAGSAGYVDSSGGSCFAPVPSQLVGPAGAVSSPYVRPYVITLPEGASESSRKWGRQGLDLNSGPVHADEVKDDRLPSLSRQMQVVNTQRFMEDQARLYQVAGGAMKRKEPDGGWEPERFTFKQPSWQ